MIEQATWTIAYRKRTANRFLRVTNWSGTWSQALAMSQVFAEANPDLQVWYTSTRAAELSGGVAIEDVANIMVDSGKRIRIVEGGELPAEMIARIPAADVARQRWIDRKPIAEPALSETEAHNEALAICASIPADGRPADVTALLMAAELVTDAHENLVLVRRARVLLTERPEPARAPAACLHAGCHPGRCVYGRAAA